MTEKFPIQQEKQTPKSVENVPNIEEKLENIFQDFQKEKNPLFLLDKLKQLKATASEADYEKAWGKNKIENFFNILEDDSFHWDINYPTYYKDFINLLCLGEMKVDDIEYQPNPLNMKILNALLTRMHQEKEEGYSDFILSFISHLNKQLFINDPETENELEQELWSAGYLIDGCISSYKSNKNNLLRVLKIVKGMRIFIPAAEDSLDFGPHMENDANEILEIIEEDNNYFINLGIKKNIDDLPLKDAPLTLKRDLLQYCESGYTETDERQILHDFNFYLRTDNHFNLNCRRIERADRIEEYNDISLKENSTVDPLFCRRDSAAYSPLSKNIAIIYASNNRVDSFFTLNETPSRRVTLVELLAQEGFDDSSLDENEYAKLLYNYQAMLELPLRKHLEEKFGFKLNDLSIRQQLQFLNYISSKTTAEVEQSFNTLSKSPDKAARINQLKAFLSLEIDANNGDRILEISQTLSSEDVAKVFSKIAQLIDATEKDLAELIQEGQVDQTEIRKHLLQSAHEIIIRFSNTLKSDSSNDSPVKNLLLELERTKTENTLLASLLKSIKKSNTKIDWEIIRDLKLDLYDSTQLKTAAEISALMKEHLSDEDIADTLAIAERNWQEISAMKELVVQSLKESLKDNRKQKIFVMRYQGKIISFLRFEPTDDDTEYFGSFNVEASLRGLNVGDEMIDKALIEEGKDKKLIALTSPRMLIGTSYVEKAGFVIDGYVEDYHQTREPLFSITADQKNNPSYRYRLEGKETSDGLDCQSLMAKYQPYENVDELVGQDSVVLRYKFPDDLEKLKTEMPKLLIKKDDEMKELPNQDLTNKYIATRYFRDKTNQEEDIRYLVLEKVINPYTIATN